MFNQNEYMKAYRRKNRKKIQEINRKYYLKNKDRVKKKVDSVKVSALKWCVKPSEKWFSTKEGLNKRFLIIAKIFGLCKLLEKNYSYGVNIDLPHSSENELHSAVINISLYRYGICPKCSNPMFCYNEGSFKIPKDFKPKLYKPSPAWCLFCSERKTKEQKEVFEKIESLLSE